MKIAVTSRSFSCHPVLRAELKAAFPGSNITYNEERVFLAGDALTHYLQGHDMAIIALEKLDAAVLRGVPELKVISKYGVGVDTLDLKELQSRGIRLGWTAGVNRRSVSELVICFAITLLRHVKTAHDDVLEGFWRQMKGGELSGRKFGIIGCGRVGKDLVSLLNAFGCKLIVNDVVDYPLFYSEYNLEPMGLEDLLREADLVSLHTPLDNSTRNILSRDRIALMKQSAILINLARGGLVDERALKVALKKGHLAGAAFDVFSSEPPADQELLRLPNFLVTPHIGGSSEEAILAMGRAAIKGLKNHGEPIKIISQRAPDGLSI